MNRFATTVLFVCLSAASALAAMEGAWTASSGKKPDSLHLNVTRGRSVQSGVTVPYALLAGLSQAEVQAAGVTPVRFAMRREAGTIAFEGTFRGGQGAGLFTFTPDRRFPDAVRALGVEFRLDRKGRSSEEEDLLTLALHDVSTPFIRSMIAEGYRAGLDDYLAMRIFDVTPQYIREMRSLGFRAITQEELISCRIHRVTPEYVRQVRKAGWDLSLEELQASRIHGATPEFAEEMRKVGYPDLSHDDLVSFRIHGVTAALIARMRELGYDGLTADELVSMQIHRVTPEYILELARAGYTKVPVDKLVSMRIHGIDAKVAAKLRGD